MSHCEVKVSMNLPSENGNLHEGLVREPGPGPVRSIWVRERERGSGGHKHFQRITLLLLFTPAENWPASPVGEMRDNGSDCYKFVKNVSCGEHCLILGVSLCWWSKFDTGAQCSHM